MKATQLAIKDLLTFSASDLYIMMNFYNAKTLQDLATTILARRQKASLPSGIDSNMRGFTWEQVKERLGIKGDYYSNVDLTNADLQDAQLQDSKLNKVNFSGSNLQGANLSNSEIKDTNFSGANLSNADMSFVDVGYGKTNFTDANLQGANLRLGKFRSSSFRNSNLRGANLAGAYIKDGFMDGAEIAGANLIGAKLENIPNGMRYVKTDGFPIEWYTSGASAIDALQQRVAALEENVGNNVLDEIKQHIKELWYAPPGGGPGYQEGYDAFKRDIQ